jgi:hypothetical protein
MRLSLLQTQLKFDIDIFQKNQRRRAPGLLSDMLSAGVVRPLGNCGCHSSAPALRPAQRPSQSKKEKVPIACSLCPRCDVRRAVSYAGTPFDQGRNRLGLVRTLHLAHGLQGNQISRAAAEESLFKGTVSEMWRQGAICSICARTYINVSTMYNAQAIEHKYVFQILINARAFTFNTCARQGGAEHLSHVKRWTDPRSWTPIASST